MIGIRARTTLLFLLFGVAIGCSSQQATKNRIPDLGGNLVDLLREHRYDDAIAAANKALTGDSRDARIYSWLALIHIARAQNDAAKRQDDVDAAVRYAKKSIDLNRDALIRYDASNVLEAAGDIEARKRCEYYAEAAELLQALSQDPEDKIKRIASTGMIRLLKKKTDSHCSK